MRLLAMTVTNFKGIRSFTLEPQGRDAEVYGANATGKTTLADAFQWLLFGKDSAGKTDFEVLPLDTDGKRVAGITEGSVEATLAYDGLGIHDGQQATLKRVYREVWTKKRGRAEQELTGHTVDYFINGVPTKMAEYQGFIRGLMDEEKFRLLTNPRYFNELLKPDGRRKIITGMDRQITDADVLVSDQAFVGLTDALLKHQTIDNIRKVVEAESRKTNGELDKLPVRIDEAQRAIPEAQQVQGDTEALRKTRAGKASLLAQMDAGGGIAEKTKTLREIEGQITDLDNLHRQAVGREISKAQAAVDKLITQRNGWEAELRATSKLMASETAIIQELDRQLAKLGVDWEKATAETFQHEDVTSCYACGQSLPQTQVDEAHRKAEASFNLDKSRKVEAIEREGNATRELLKAAQGRHAKASYAKEEAEKQLAVARAKVPDLQIRVDDLRAKQNQPSPDPLRHQLADKVLGLQAEIEDLKKGQNTQAKHDLAREIEALDYQIANAERAKANEERRQSGMKRVAELKEEQKRLGKVYEELEHQRTLCEKFVVAKAKMITERVNSRFKLARFKLFDQQINGGISDTCEVTVNGVPYSDLNNAMRINVGLDIINTLGELYGTTAPVFCDNAEAVCELLPTRSQQIRLYVSASDPVLRVEAPEKVLAKA